jgi:hypothetical protein
MYPVANARAAYKVSGGNRKIARCMNIKCQTIIDNERSQVWVWFPSNDNKDWSHDLNPRPVEYSKQ